MDELRKRIEQLAAELEERSRNLAQRDRITPDVWDASAAHAYAFAARELRAALAAAACTIPLTSPVQLCYTGPAARSRAETGCQQTA